VYGIEILLPILGFVHRVLREAMRLQDEFLVVADVCYEVVLEIFKLFSVPV
jgi:hypothetical protein